MAELLFDKIFGNLYFRKAYHFLGGMVIVFAVFQLARDWFIFMATIYFIAFLLIGKRISFAILGILLLYVISGSKNLTGYTAIIWLVGDGTAGIIGGTFGRRKLPWNNQKTILGSISFFVSSWIVILTLLFVTTEADGMQLLIISTISCLVACFVESWPFVFIRDRKPDDNLIVLVLSGSTMWGLSQLFGLGNLFP